jgi:NAD(P)-dependent dehydrogenase (short-subunit alcohol dehydrogenase family)
VFDLTGRVALVTGAGQSVGAGIAATLAEAGAKVAVNDLVEERAEASAATITGHGGTAVAAPFDVTDLEATRGGMAKIEADLGPVDILVNNAGIVRTLRAAQFRDLDPEEWRPSVDLNLFGVINCVSATIDGMCERGWGRVITISSAAGTVGLDIGVSIYAAGKGGAISFMRHLALETAKFGVTANSLALGMMANNEGRIPDSRISKVNPVGRLGTGRDVGVAVVWLAAEGSWVTGQTIEINGGAVTT